MPLRLTPLANVLTPVLVALAVWPVVAAHAITLEESYHHALERSESVAIEARRLDQAAARNDQARGALLPNLSLMAGYQRQDPPSTAAASSSASKPYTSTVRLNAQQPLFRGFREYAGLAAAGLAQDAQALELEAARRTLYLNVAESYYEIQAAAEDLRNLESLRDLTQKRVHDLDVRSRKGRTRVGDLISAQALEASLKAQIEAARTRLEQARDAFQEVTGFERTAGPEAAGSPGAAALPSAPAPVAEYLGRIDTRPDVKARRKLVELARENVRIARGGHLPSVDLNGNLYLLREGAQSDSRWDAGVSLSLPLYAGGTVSAAVREAAAKLAEAEINEVQLRRSAEREIRSAHDAVAGGLRQDAALKASLELARKNFEVQSRDNDYGLATSLDVLQAMNSFQEAKRTLDRARAQVLVAGARLRALSGEVPQ